MAVGSITVTADGPDSAPLGSVGVVDVSWSQNQRGPHLDLLQAVTARDDSGSPAPGVTVQLP